MDIRTLAHVVPPVRIRGSRTTVRPALPRDHTPRPAPASSREAIMAAATPSNIIRR
ncbi:hypothetical protein IMZ48_07960 [Candidatus Bathyarchaeota archaeon]|nr:hypothetical protein [Candidatus Bathyarchaeota archaeon]